MAGLKWLIQILIEWFASFLLLGWIFVAHMFDGNWEWDAIGQSMNIHIGGVKYIEGVTFFYFRNGFRVVRR